MRMCNENEKRIKKRTAVILSMLLCTGLFSGVSYVEAAESEIAGDVNLDGKVTLTDAKMIMQYCNKAKKLSAEQKTNADVNGDGKINLTDAKLVMKIYNEGYSQEVQTKSIMVSLDKSNPSEKYEFVLTKEAQVKVTVKVLDVSGTGNDEPIRFASIGTNQGQGSLFYDLETSDFKKNKSFVSEELVNYPCEWGNVEFKLPKELESLKIKVTFSIVGGEKLIKSMKKLK